MMIIQQKTKNGYRITVYHEDHMLPDPRFVRVYEWGALPPKVDEAKFLKECVAEATRQYELDLAGDVVVDMGEPFKV